MKVFQTTFSDADLTPKLVPMPPGVYLVTSTVFVTAQPNTGQAGDAVVFDGGQLPLPQIALRGDTDTDYSEIGARGDVGAIRSVIADVIVQPVLAGPYDGTFQGLVVLCFAPLLQGV